MEGTEDWEHWQEYPTETETFEIVGVYGSDHDPYYPYATGSINLYIPDSCMPEGYGQETQVHMDSFSFRLRSAEDTEAFLQEVEGPLAEMGMQVRFCLLYTSANPIVPLSGNRCNGCNMEIPSASAKRIREDGVILECENCGRLLYAPKD